MTLNGRSRRLVGTLAMELASQRDPDDPKIAAKILEKLLEVCDRCIQPDRDETDADRDDR